MFFIRRMTSIRVSFHRYRLLTSLYYLRDFVRIENNIYELFSFISDAKDHFTLVCYSDNISSKRNRYKMASFMKSFGKLLEFSRGTGVPFR